MRARPVPSISAQRLSNALRDQRLRHGLTQGELAERAGLSLKYLGEVERGTANVTIDALDKIARVLDWDLFSGDHAPISPRVRRLLLRRLARASHRFRAVIHWLRSLDPAERVSVSSASAADSDQREHVPTARRRALPRRRPQQS